MTKKTAYAQLGIFTSRIILLVVLILVVLPALPHPTMEIPGERRWGEPAAQRSDALLYKSIVVAMENGQKYYEAAATEHRNLHYPTAPAQVFRMPTLAWVLVILHFYFLQLLALGGLYGTSIVLLYRELLASKKSASIRIVVIAVSATGLSIAGATDAIYRHEVWSALLIAISLLCYRATFWGPAVVCGLFACLIREVSLPYMVIMAGFAIYERHWKQFYSWSGAILVFVAAFATHILFASKLHGATDIVSSGWLAFGGWDFAMATAKWNIVLHILPYPLIALAVCLGILGLAGAQDERARRAAVIVSAYLTAFLFVGRPDNYYWGTLYAPLLPPGWLFAPRAIRDLIHSAFPEMKRLWAA